MKKLKATFLSSACRQILTLPGRLALAALFGVVVSGTPAFANTSELWNPTAGVDFFTNGPTWNPAVTYNGSTAPLFNANSFNLLITNNGAGLLGGTDVCLYAGSPGGDAAWTNTIGQLAIGCYATISGGGSGGNSNAFIMTGGSLTLADTGGNDFTMGGASAGSGQNFTSKNYFTMSGGSLNATNSTGDNLMGMPESTANTANFNGGTANFSDLKIGGRGAGTVNVNGGTVNFLKNSGPSSGVVWIGRGILTNYTGANGTFNLISGTVNATSLAAGTATVVIGGAARNCFLNVSGGTLNANGIMFGTSSNKVGAGYDHNNLYVSGGTINLDSAGIGASGTYSNFMALSGGTFTTLNGDSWSITNNGYFLSTFSNSPGPGIVNFAPSVAATNTLNGPIVGSGGMNAAGPGLVILTGANTYTGNTMVSGGTLRLAAGASVAGSVVVGGNALLDVSPAPVTLASGMTLSNLTSTATINGSIDASVGNIGLNYANGTPSITVTNGTLNLSSTTGFFVNNTGAPLPVGSYLIVSAGPGGSVAGSVTLSQVPVSGNALAGDTAATVSIVGGQLYLVVAYTAPAVVGQYPVPYNSPFTLFAGASPTFSIVANPLPDTFYWFTNGVQDRATTGANLTLAHIQGSSLSVYCIVSNFMGTATSATWNANIISGPTVAYPAMVVSGNPIGYWRLNEGDNGGGNVGAIANDYVGGNNGIYNNVILSQSGYNPVADPLDTSALFGSYPFYPSPGSYAGSIQGLDVSAANGANGEFSVEAMVNAGVQQTANNGIVAKGYFGQEEFTLDTGGSANAFRFEVRNAAGTAFNASSTFNSYTNGHWYHLVGVCDEANGVVNLYINGALVASTSIPAGSGIYNSFNTPMTIGARATSATSGVTNQFYGNINDVAVYNYPLSSAQIVSHYVAAGFPPSVTQQTSTNLTLFAGGGANMGIVAIGALPITYQWYSNNIPVSGATATNHILANVQPPNTLQTWYCVAANSIGVATSAVVSVSIIPAPTAPYPTAVLVAHPIGYWRLNEADDGLGDGNPGATAYDSVGGYNGTYANVILGDKGYSSITDPTETSAWFGDLTSSNSDADQILGFDLAGTNVNSELSVECLVALTNNTGGGIVAKGYGGGGEEFCLDSGGTGRSFRFFVHSAAGTTYTAATTLAPITNGIVWYHLVGVCDEANGLVSLYVNGALAGSTSIPQLSGILADGGWPMTIGARSASKTSGNTLQSFGYINDVAIYNYALSSAQVTSHYNVAGFPPTFTQQPATSFNLFAGGSVTWSVAAAGGQPISYQWYLNNVAISGATSTNYTAANVQPANAVQTYYCVASNSVSTTTNAVITVNVLPDPTAPYPATVLAASPVGYWRLNEPNVDNLNNGTVANDYWGGNNGIYTNTVLGQPGYTAYNTPNTDLTETAAEFGYDGVSKDNDAYGINGVDFSTTNGSSNFSIEAWVNGTLQTKDGAIVSKGYSGGEEFVLDTGSDSPVNHAFRFLVRDASGGSHSAGSTVTPGSGVWQHLVGVCNEANGTLTLYVNGVPVGTGTITPGTGILATTNRQMIIGARPSTSTTNVNDLQFVGSVNDVAVYNYALSSSQVVTHYVSAGEPPFLTQTPASSVAVNAGASVVLPLSIIGTSSMGYQWFDQNGGTNVAAAVVNANQVNASLTIPNVPASWNNDTLQFTVTNAYGSASIYVTFTVYPSVTAPAGSYARNILQLNPAGYWPMHEVEAPAQGDVEVNYGTLGLLGTAFYPDWAQNVGAFTRNYQGALAGDYDSAVFFNEKSSNSGDVTNALFIPHTSPLSTLNPPFSVECWVLPTSQTLQGDIWSQNGYEGLNAGASGNGDGNVNGIRLYWDAPGLLVYTYANGSANHNLFGTIAAVTNVWHHVVVTCDASTNMSIFVDGNAQKTNTPAVGLYSPDFWTPFEVGNGRGNSRALPKAGVDEVAIYTNVLDAGVIAQHYSDGTNATPATSYNSDVTNANPVVYLRMDNPGYNQPSANTWPVVTNYASGLDGVYSPGTMPGIVPGPASPGGHSFGGLSGSGVAQLSGVSSYADVGYQPAFDPQGAVPFSVTAMFRGNPADNRSQTIVGHTTSSWRLWMNTSGKVQWQIAGKTLGSTGVYNDGNWHHVVAVYTPALDPNTTGTNIIYVDGVLDTSLTTASTNGVSPGSPLDVMIGSDPQYTNNPVGIGQQWAGQVCEVALFNNALSASQAQVLYSSAQIAPYITGQPLSGRSTYGGAGSYIYFGVLASGSTLNYQWYFNPNPSYSGATRLVDNVVHYTNSTTLQVTVTNLAPSDSGYYFVVITNSFGSVTSALASLTIVPSQAQAALTPASMSLYANQPFTYTVQAAGAPPLFYQWYKGGVGISNATNDSYTAIATAGSTSYSCQVSNAYNGFSATNSGTVTLTGIAWPSGLYPQTVLSNTPVAYWRLGETSGNIAYDYAGGHNGYYTNVQQGVPGYNPADPDLAANFGTNTAFQASYTSNSYVGELDLSGNGTPNLDFSQPSGGNGEFTVEVWENARGGALVAKGYGNGGEQFVLDFGYTAAGYLRFFVRNAAGTTGAANSGIGPDGNWHHVVGVCDQVGGAVHLYVDGVDQADGAFASGTGVKTGSAGNDGLGDDRVSIGSRTAGQTSTSFGVQDTGTIDEVALYNVALNSGQVLAHYNANVTVVTPGLMSIVSVPNTDQVQIIWNFNGTLQSSTNVLGPYTTVTGAASPYTTSATNASQFYRVKQN